MRASNQYFLARLAHLSRERTMRLSLAFLAAFALIGAPSSFASGVPTKEEIADALKNPALGAPIPFAAVLSADNELAPTKSNATGQARFSLDRADLTLRWNVTYRNLTSAMTGAHVHGPGRPGDKAEILIDLGADGLINVHEGSVVLNEAQLSHFLNGRVYINIQTEKYKEGEIRGQIERVLPTTAQ
jgi:hypothetical protein